MKQREPATLESILCEIKKSREINDEQHQQIFKSSEVSMKLSEDVNHHINNFVGFSNTVRFVRNTVFTLGALYLIFEDPLHRFFGG